MGFNSVENEDGSPLTVAQLKRYLDSYAVEDHDIFVVVDPDPNYKHHAVMRIGHPCMRLGNQPQTHFLRVGDPRVKRAKEI